jgi:hypothetical protein
MLTKIKLLLDLRFNFIMKPCPEILGLVLFYQEISDLYRNFGKRSHSSAVKKDNEIYLDNNGFNY